MSITQLRQGDPMWGATRIGKTKTTVAAKGCTLTSCCMVLEKLRGYHANPGDAARFWAFNSQAKILWTETHFEGMKFKWRGYNADYAKVAEYTNSPDKAAIIEVNKGAHWVYLDSIDLKLTMTILDPIDGQKYVGLPKKYKFTGYALFEKDVANPPEWAKESWEKGKSKSPFLNSVQADKEVSVGDIQQVFLELGRIKEVGKMPAYRLSVILDKLGLFGK